MATKYDVILTGWPVLTAGVWRSDEPCEESTQGGVIGRFDTREEADEAARAYNTAH